MTEANQRNMDVNSCPRSSACVYSGTGKAQARMSPQTPEKQGWSHQTCSPAPGTRCLPSPTCLGAPARPSPQQGHCPSSWRFFQASNLNLHPWFPLPGTAVPSVGIGASAQSLFLQMMLPFPPFILLRAPSSSSLLWNSRKSHFNLSGLTSQPPAPTSSLRAGQHRAGKASGKPPAAPAQPLLPLPMPSMSLLTSRSHIPVSGAGHPEGWSCRKIPGGSEIELGLERGCRAKSSPGSEEPRSSGSSSRCALRQSCSSTSTAHGNQHGEAATGTAETRDP